MNEKVEKLKRLNSILKILDADAPEEIGDALRDYMDILWYELTPEERKKVTS